MRRKRAPYIIKETYEDMKHRGLPHVPIFMNRDEAVNRNILYKKWQKAVASPKAREELPQGLSACTRAPDTQLLELEEVGPEEIRETSKT